MKSKNTSLSALLIQFFQFILFIHIGFLVYAQGNLLHTKNASSFNDHHELRLAIEESQLSASDSAINDLFGFSVSISGARALVGAKGHNSEMGAAYIFDLINDVWVQSVKLEANDKAIADNFGHSVSLFGDRALIGAYLDDDSAIDSGSAYIFELSGNTWIQTAKITSNDAAMNDNFGFSVSLFGNRALIGAYLTDENFDNSGSAYVFDLDAGIWAQSEKLLSDAPALNDWMGYSVSLGENRALLGSRLDGENGNDTGSATVFDYSLGVWSHTVELFANDANTSDQFGISVGLSGDRVIIGSPLSDESGSNSGAAYIFDLVSNVWEQTKKIIPSDVNDNDSFGLSVALSGNQAIIASTLDDDNGIDSGSAYLFDLILGDWVQTDKLIGSNGNANDLFGTSVAISEYRVLVGAYLDDTNGLDFGTAYVYKINESPLAINDSLLILQNAPTTIINVLDNDTDTDGGNKVIIAVTSATHGVVGFSAQLISYKPNIGYCNDGENWDTFSYTLNGGSSAEVSVKVSCTYKLGGNLSGLTLGSQVVLTNNMGDELLLNSNGLFAFLMPQLDLTPYSVSIITEPSSPIQTCSLLNASGFINHADINNINLDCNTEPTILADEFMTVEDGILTVQAGVIFENDSDVESDDLFVLNPGIFNTNGIGGLIFIESDGGFEYLPTDNLFGQSSFTLDVSDGFNTISSTISIETLPVNDAPEFSIIGDIDATTLLSNKDSQLVIPNFVTDFIFGPDNESSQQVQQFDLQVYSDFNQVLNSISVDNNGTLNLDFSRNYGAVIIRMSLKDNGGTSNSGLDTSNAIEFIITYTDLIFENGFELEPDLRVLDYIASLNNKDFLSAHPQYDSHKDGITYLGHQLNINRDYSNALMKSIILYWFDEVSKKKEKRTGF